MSKSERIKEELSWLRVVFSLLVVIDASLVAWIVQNFDTADSLLLFATVVLVVMISGGLIWVNRVVYRRLSQLEKL